MANSIDLARNHAQVLWQQTRVMATKMANKVDKATLAKIARVAGPILAVLMVLYVINALLKRKDIDAGEVILQQFEEMFNKLKDKIKQLLVFEPVKPDEHDLEKGKGNDERADLDPVPTVGNQQIIHQGTTVFLKQEDRTLDVALVIEGLLIAVQCTQDDQNPHQFNPQRAFVQGRGVIAQQTLEDLYAGIELPNGFHLAPLNGVRVQAQLSSNPRAMELLPPHRVSRVEQVNQELLSSSIIQGSTKLPNFANSAVQLWNDSPEAPQHRDFFNFRPFQEKIRRQEFDHKNAEILNQVMQFLFISYWAKNQELQLGGLFQEMKDDLKNYDLEPLTRLFAVIDNRESYATNEQARTEIQTALSAIYLSGEYQHELANLTKNLDDHQQDTVADFAQQFPLVFFAQTMARAFYLEVDLNDFENRWIQKVLGATSKPNASHYAAWVSEQRTQLDSNAKGLPALLSNAWNEGMGGIKDYFRIQVEKISGSFPGLGFNPVHTNNCPHRLWTQETSNKQNICIGIPVPTRDNFLYGETKKVIFGRPTADMVEDLKLLLDNFALTGQTFMSFMHLKIADKVTGSIDWTHGEEHIRAKALVDVAESKRYRGTYSYFSIPMDGYLFSNPSKVIDPTMTGIKGTDLVTSTLNKDNLYRVMGKDQIRPGLFQFWMHAMQYNRHGWYIMYEQMEKTYGDQLRDMYQLRTDQPAIPQICHNLFMEVHQFFFESQKDLTAEQWQVFQVLLGVRLIETFSQFADVFHNTCKDAIDRAAIFLMARRYLQLIREGKTQDAQELWDAFVDYVKRAMAAKIQAPIPHRHHTAEATLHLLEKFKLKDQYLEATKNDPGANYTMDRTTIRQRLTEGSQQDMEASWIAFE